MTKVNLKDNILIMEMIQVEIKDQYQTWGIYDILEAKWDHNSKELTLICVDWYRNGQDLMVMESNFDGTFSNVNGGNLIAKIV